MKDAAAEAFRDWVGVVLIAIGWNASSSAWVGGTLMAMGGASIARAWQKERDDLELWAVLGGGFFFSFMAGAAAIHFTPHIPVQIIMGLAGFFSRFGIKLALDVAERMSRKGETIASRVIDRVLPGDDKEGDG